MQGVFNPNILIYNPPNSAEGLHFSAFHLICTNSVSFSRVFSEFSLSKESVPVRTANIMLSPFKLILQVRPCSIRDNFVHTYILT